MIPAPDIRHIPGSRTYIYNDPVEGSRNVTPFVDEIPGFDWHTDRNLFNFVSGKMPKPIFQNEHSDRILHYIDHNGNKWLRDFPRFAGPYHGYENSSMRGTRRYKGCQAVYDSNEVLITEGPKRGTFDYETPDIFSVGDHKKKDVNPHKADSGYRSPDLSKVF